jgi:hypothetical protein
LRSKESVQDWTTKFGLVNSADHSTTMSPEDMEASEVFSNFAENWKTPAKLGRRQLAIPERILPSSEDDFAFVKNLPDDAAELIVQLGWDPQRGGRIVRAIGNIESALETSKGATQTTFEIINDSLVAGKSTSEILLAKLENIKSCIGVRSKDEGPVASSTLWGAIYELADMFTDEPGRHKEDVVFSAEEMDKLQELLDTCYGNHLHPFIKESLKDFITLADSNKNTELLLDGADRVNDDLKHIVKRIKLLEDTQAVKNSRPALC